jgi:hypothetical protein
MSQAVSAPSTGVRGTVGGKSRKNTGKIINLADHRPFRLRDDVPPFDARNPDHLRAWQAIYDYGRIAAKYDQERS